MELDKTEAALNKGKSVDLTATIYPSDADKRNVNWSLSSNLGILEELSYDENSNTRTARFTAG
ncbi:MAG: Ig-like domain-containing protein, partial [Lachnospiraceae bacterium]|nr:Ig-like domain-containing protein [Lachnospiraceae bacterium]